MYADPRHVDQTVDALKLTHKLYARAYKTILVHLLVVIQSVLQAQSVLETRLASTRTARILALMPVVQMQSVELLIIARFVSVNFATQEIRLQDATLYLVSFYFQISFIFLLICIEINLDTYSF